MRKNMFGKKLTSMILAAVVAGTMLAGCGSSNEAATEQASEAVTASTEAASEIATEAATEVTKDAESAGAKLTTESGPVVSDEVNAAEEGLMPFVYVGNSEENRILTQEAFNLAQDEFYYSEDNTERVMIPAWVIGRETEDDNGLELVANIMVYIFKLEGTTLELVSGGSFPCKILATNGVIDTVQFSYTDEITLSIVCDGDESLVQAIHDDDALDASLRNNIGMYINNYGYDIDGYTIDGGATINQINVD